MPASDRPIAAIRPVKIATPCQNATRRRFRPVRIRKPRIDISTMPREWMAVVSTMRQRPHVQLELSTISVPRLFGRMLMREHIRRFGQYVLDMDVLALPLNRQPPPFELAL